MSQPPHVLVAVPLTGVGPGASVPIAGATLHHLQRVLRLREGSVLSVTDGAGRVARAVLADDGATLVDPVTHDDRPAPRIMLVQALSKGRRAEDAVRVAAELGVDRIIPVVAERTQGRPGAEEAEALAVRWRSVAVAALEQSRGTRLAEVDRPVGSLHGIGPDGALRLLAVPGGEDLAALLAGPDTADRPEEVVIAIGPEGGWSPEEVAAALADGWRSVGLGPTVLRTEHAGPVAVAVVAALTGRWRSIPDATLQPPPSRSPDVL